MRAEVDSEFGSSSSARARSPPPAYTNGQEEDSQAEWAREEQQMMMRHQDETMDTISGTLATLAAQAGLMGQEINEHNEQVAGLVSAESDGLTCL